MMKNAVTLLLAKHRLEQRIKEVGAGSDSRLHELEDRINQMQQQMMSEHEHAEELKQAFEDAKIEVQAVHEHEKLLADDLEKEAKQRKKLHNQIEDMKGAIRVFCRIRPLSGSELARGNIDITEYMTDRCSIELFPPVDDPSNPGQKKKGPHDRAKKYTFDAVFSPVDGQEAVFEDVSHVVQSAVDGYNVCIFAYGQTGSGKTWTMSGNGANPGVQPRLVDLLKTVPGAEQVGKLDRKGQLAVRKDAHGRVQVGGVSMCTAKTRSELGNILASGQAKRHVSATKMNSESSRSHLVSTIIIEATDRKTKLTTTGKLTLVDLAGSESQKKTGASGDTLKEAMAINKSLSALGNVISALTKGDGHVPYRNSKLTELLQDGLGGNAKTLLFVNASPADYNFTETCGSFEFALRCKKVKNGKGAAQVESAEVIALKKELAQLRKMHGDADETDL
eukprot:g945.t1